MSLINRNIFKWYKQRLEGIDGIQLNAEAEGVTNTYWVVSAIVDPSYGLRKEDFIKRFKDHNIDTRPFFYPVSSMPAYENYKRNKDMAMKNPVSYELSPRGISFPSAAIITEDQVALVCSVFKNILDYH